MAVLIVGASGATGRQLVEQLIKRGEKVKLIVRSPEKLPESWKNNDLVLIIQASVLDIKPKDMEAYVEDCYAVASCLGHNINLKGIYGKPRLLVTDALKFICQSIKKNTSVNQKVKFVLMNTTGNQNRDLNEPISKGQKIVIGLVRLLVPPQVDNENAADYLRIDIGQKDDKIEWTAVRPDGLLDEDQVTEYEVHPSPIRSAIFDAGTTSRINVGHFMADLITNSDLWNKWKGQMPVIYNKEAPSSK